MPSHYSGDPRWITVRYGGAACAKCGDPLKKGDDAFYYPRGKSMFGKACGHDIAASRDFESARADEDFYNGVC
jgi:hypothetical protein